MKRFLYLIISLIIIGVPIMMIMSFWLDAVKVVQVLLVMMVLVEMIFLSNFISAIGEEDYE